MILVLICMFSVVELAAAESTVEADLLVVGGTESGCAAAVQAARMGVQRIVIVNDIEWLGGQFSAEGLGAIDESRAHGYNGTVPIPRSGIFRDVIDAIEQKNLSLYGVARPGNTRVITTCRPVVSEKVFRELLKPYEDSGTITRYSNYHVKNVLTDGSRVTGVEFHSTDPPAKLTVRAKLTIDASDWGDVIQGSGAAWDAGVDSKSAFDEPSAPKSGESSTDMNPITWCMILEQQSQETLIPKPDNYDEKYFTGVWGWIDEEFAYTTRRLVDGQGFEKIHHPDLLLINTPPIDYPLDVYPAHVVNALEAMEPGASKKNLVAMTPAQREIVFQDARNHSLKFYYYLQQRFPKFRSMKLSNEFGTENHLPPKPYIRESLRLVSKHIIREQEVLGFESRSDYATTMFPDAVFSWQFELDFHPTHRSFTTEAGDRGPWEADFRGNRRFGRGGTGRCVFPLRALIPKEVSGLLGAQKNLGYTSLVGSSCRLHDQSIHAGQASGAIAAVCLKHNEDPDGFYLNTDRLAEIWSGLLEPSDGTPLVIWPFADVDPSDAGFVAIQQLALRRALPLTASSTSFRPDEIASSTWIGEFESAVKQAGYSIPGIIVTAPETKRNIAMTMWKQIQSQPVAKRKRVHRNDADDDGILDAEDALPFTVGEISWRVNPLRDGRTNLPMKLANKLNAFNFTTPTGPEVNGFKKDSGQQFRKETGFGWNRDQTESTRLRDVDKGSPRDGFVFTRSQDVWECEVPDGKWKVHACIGDIGHDQLGQYLMVESEAVAMNVNTAAGKFLELETEVEVKDGRLTLTLGTTHGESNTCLNWVWFVPSE